jgi:hypothetical protein
MRAWQKAAVLALGCGLAAVPGGACRSGAPEAQTDIEPRASASPAKVEAGGAVAVTYHWTVGPKAPKVGEGLQAFVHFVDPSGALLFTDDHVPVPPPQAWQPGQVYSYKRIVLVPGLLPPGPVAIRMGLFSPKGERMALRGTSAGRREYKIGDLDVLKNAGRAHLTYEDGWYAPDAPSGDPFTERRWMRREARASFRTRGRDVVVIVEAETTHTFGATPILTLAIAGAGVRLPVTSPDPFLERVRFKAASLGPRWSELRLSMSESFVPKLLNLGDDTRELSLWVRGLVIGEAGEMDEALAAGAQEAGPLEGPSKVDVAPAGAPGRSRPPTH